MRDRLSILLLSLLLGGCASLGVRMPLTMSSEAPSSPLPEGSGAVTGGIELARANAPIRRLPRPR